VLDRAYACENAVAKEKTCTSVSARTSCTARSKGAGAKTDYDGQDRSSPEVVSKKGRPFSAHLKLENGKVGFEFAERKPKKSARARRSRLERNNNSSVKDR